MIKYLLMQMAVGVSVGSDGKINPGGVIPTPDSNSVLTGVLNTVYFAAGVAAVIVIIIAGIMYATSEGDSGKTAKAKNMILYAVVGLVVIILAFVITGFIMGNF